MSQTCKLIGCNNHAPFEQDYCVTCQQSALFEAANDEENRVEKYPYYFRPVSELTEVDVYAVHNMFAIQDHSGALHQASRKLLLSCTRGKPSHADIKEARDSLNCWLQLNQETNTNERSLEPAWPDLRII